MQNEQPSMIDSAIEFTNRIILSPSPGQFSVKVASTFIAVLISAISASSYVYSIFLFMIVCDTILGTMVAVKENGWRAIKPIRWLTGPAMKAFIFFVFLTMAALFDLVSSLTPVRHISESPILIGAAGFICATVLWEGGQKVHKLFPEYGLVKWLTERIKKPTV